MQKYSSHIYRERDINILPEEQSRLKKEEEAELGQLLEGRGNSI